MTLTGSLGTALDKKALGERCKEARQQARLSQMEMAELLGYKSATSIANKESGLTYPSLVDVGFLSFRSGLSIDWIVTGRDSKRPSGDVFATPEVLSNEEAELIKQYRSLNERQKTRMAFLLLKVIAEPSQIQFY